MWMIFFILLIPLIFIQSFFLLSTKINLFPEMYFLPYLVSKGLIPYRDFFDHHGFIAYYFIAPFISIWGIGGVKLFFFIINSLNLILILLILKKTTTKLGFILGSILYVLLNFYISANNPWYETIITFFFLLSYLLIINKKYYSITGILIGLATLIKPNALVLFILLIIFSKNKKIFAGFIITIILAIFYLLVSSSLFPFLEGVFNFNFFLSHVYHPPFDFPWKIWFMGAILLFISIIIYFKNQKIEFKFTFIFLVASIPFLTTGFGGEHLIVFAVFFCLFISQSISHQPNLLSKIFITTIFLFISILTLKDIAVIQKLNNITPWQEGP